MDMSAHSLKKPLRKIEGGEQHCQTVSSSTVVRIRLETLCNDRHSKEIIPIERLHSNEITAHTNEKNLPSIIMA